MQKKEIYAASLMDKNQFIVNGCLNMRLILEKFVVHFHDLYGDQNETFLEEEGRKYFLLYLRPIINGTGNYYIEAIPLYAAILRTLSPVSSIRCAVCIIRSGGVQ